MKTLNEFLQTKHINTDYIDVNYVEPYYTKDIKESELDDGDYFAVVWSEYPIDSNDIITKHNGKTYYRRACGIFKHVGKYSPIQCYCIITASGEEKTEKMFGEVSLGKSSFYLPVTQEEYKKLNRLYTDENA